MRRLVAFVLLCTLAGVGCASTSPSPPSTAASDAEPKSPLGSPFAERRGWSMFEAPLIVDRTDLRLGTTVHFRRIPNASEMHDLLQLPGLSRIVLSFDAWPTDYSKIEGLNQTPEGVEIVAILPGWPPGRQASEAWNYLNLPTRIVVVVPGPPNSIDDATNLNQMRGLERVIAQMDEPSRSGFEHLQRPLSFRKIME
jgi:hypothetical protein